MSRFLYHTSCPSCGSRDNVAVYDDGHGWCFGCRKVVIEPEHRVLREQKARHRDNNSSENPDVSSNSCVLPNDYTSNISVEGLQWLDKYQLTAKEIQQNRIGWSPNGWKIRKGTIDYAPLMIFPVFDVYENLLMYQARYFGSRNDCPKYWTVGNRGVLHILGDTKGATITLVEDIVSAIKCSRFGASLPIFGSDISTELIIRIYNRFRNLNIWLDKDKRKYAHARMQSVRYLFDTVRVIDSEVDPKEYNNQELKEFLNV